MEKLMKVFTLIVSGTIGGIVGYLIAEEILYRTQGGSDDEYEVVAEPLHEEDKKAYEYAARRTNEDDKKAYEYAAAVYSTNDGSLHAVKGEIKPTNYSEQYKRSHALPPKKVHEIVTEPNVPTVIPVEVFEVNTMRNFTLTYYEGDDVLVNEMDVVIDNPESLLGPDALTSFGLYSGDPDTVFIQNDELGTVYEVIRVHESFEQSVLGFEPEDPVVAKREKKSKVVAEAEEETEPVPPKQKTKPRKRKVVVDDYYDEETDES